MRIGIVGAGLRGKMFADVAAGIPDARVVAFADPYLARTADEEFVRGQAVPVFGDADAMFDSARLDAVILATPDHAHAAPAVSAARRGLAMMLEKPVATSVEDTLAIADAVREGGSRCMVAFENRWNANFVKMRGLVTSGALGAPVYHAVTLSNSYYVPTTMLSWASHSSPLWFLMPHTVDLVMWLGGSRVRTVTARGTRGLLAARGIDTWDVVHVILELDDGSTATLTSSWVLPDGRPSIVDFTYNLVGSESSVSTDVTGSGLQHFSDRHATIGTLDAPMNGENNSAPAWMIRSFVQSLLAGTPLPTTIDDGIAVNEVLFAIERSLATGLPSAVTPLTTTTK